MPMSHIIQKQIIKNRIKGKKGKQRTDELNQILAELPNFNSGPYVVLRKWIEEQIEKTQTRNKIKHKEYLTVEKEGEAQLVIVGPPNIGKSSLLKAICDKQIRIGNYAFTTTIPIASTMKYSNIEIQLVEVPGLIEGANEDRGKGRRLLNVIRTSDGIIYMLDLSKPLNEFKNILHEIHKAGIKKKSIIIANKADLPGTRAAYYKLLEEFESVVPISVASKQNLSTLKNRIWKMTDLIRIYTNKEDEKPVALPNGSTVKDFAKKIHKDFINRFKTARVTGNSAKFDKQQVGLDHILEDGDIVELELRKS